MSVEIILAAASVGGTVCVVCALITTWKRNGRDQRQRDDKIREEQRLRDEHLQSEMNLIGQRLDLGMKTLIERLDDEETGLSAMNRKVANIRNHCADVTARFDERIKALQRASQK